ncbi:hypothetical protein [Candidatus Methanomassiliicoccus intestinalis]|uniref:Ribbon-helix-helix protein CopG domain-containing protein n=1 Tax=Methanomassiliicoccus intestinalis (strain Issoire-Mx1) TaxID=1295009 RepID=R9T6X5_METII|nr:hypothetical protein [Candidatus Methanomassiliicoccus intestinalis]AGN26384.1 hypothetical protein MMINT_10380 [Candidatus Methanomassiliicoccus intestinalis Issoire-Mx1]
MAREPVVIKLPKSIISYIDTKVCDGEFISRTDFIRYVMRWNIERDDEQ